MNCDVIIGADGGGTHTRLAAVLSDGTVLARGEGGGLNFNSIPVEKVRCHLREAVEALCEKAGCGKPKAISIGMSALDARANDDMVKFFAGDVFDAGRLLMDSDVYAALMGARLGQPCVMVISGTGSMVVGLDHNDGICVSGGWGYRLGDPGSGYGLSVHALREVLRILEGDGRKSTLCEAAFEYFGVSDSRDLINRLYEPAMETPRIAGFGALVLEQARNGDLLAAEIVSSEMEALAQQTYSVYRKCRSHICMYGGVFEHSGYAREKFRRMLLERDPGIEFAEPLLPPEMGAVIMYLKSVNGISDEVLNKMQETWRRTQHDGN